MSNKPESAVILKMADEIAALPVDEPGPYGSWPAQVTATFGVPEFRDTVVAALRAYAQEVSGPDPLRVAMAHACDLLTERVYGHPARSAGHNARLVLEAALESRAKEPEASGGLCAVASHAVQVGEPTRIGAVVGDQEAAEPSPISIEPISHDHLPKLIVSLSRMADRLNRMAKIEPDMGIPVSLVRGEAELLAKRVMELREAVGGHPQKESGGPELFRRAADAIREFDPFGDKFSQNELDMIERGPRDDQRVPGRETFWLVERTGHNQYVKDRSELAGLTDDPWRALRFKTERDAHEFRLRLLTLRDECATVEHMFVNKPAIGATPQKVEGAQSYDTVPARPWTYWPHSTDPVGGIYIGNDSVNTAFVPGYTDHPGNLATAKFIVDAVNAYSVRLQEEGSGT